MFFNETLWQREAASAQGAPLRALEARHDALHEKKAEAVTQWIESRHEGDAAAEASAHAAMLAANEQSRNLRDEARATLQAIDPGAPATDADYVFITFVLGYLPHGLIGLFIAVVFAAALSSTSAELNALGATTAVDLYPKLARRPAGEVRIVAATRWFTAIWGLVAVSFALFANLVENLIQAVNIIGSIFYGVVLGMFLVAFFIKHVRGHAVFVAAVVAQSLVLALYFLRYVSPWLHFSYLWYNLIGCGACVGLSVLLEFASPRNASTERSAAP